MQKKFRKLSVWSFLLALAIFILSYVLYHYTLPSGAFTTIWQPTPGKPWVTLLVSVWGVMFLFASIMSLLIGRIFFGGKESDS